MLELRAHHLLCTILYKGKGYSKAFTDNMDEVVNALHDPDTIVKLKTSPDAICSECPNAKADGSCALDDNSKATGNIQSLDEIVLKEFKLNAGDVKTSKDFFKSARENMSKEFFDKCCGACRWHEMGLCSFEEYMENIETF